MSAPERELDTGSVHAVDASFEWYRRAFQEAPIGMFVGLGDRFLRVNRAACELLGYTEEELLERNFESITHPEDLERSRENVRQLTAGEVDESRLVKRYVRKDGETIWGCLSISAIRAPSGEPLYFLAQLQDLTDVIRDQLALEQRGEQLRELARRLVTVREEERTRISRRIHDELGQSLTAIKLDLAWLRGQEEGDGVPLEAIDRVMAHLDETIGRVREIATELRPPVLDDLGLPGAIEWAVSEFRHRSGLACRVDIAGDDLSLGAGPSTALFRILQESLLNVARHAEARNVSVVLASEDDAVSLEVRDDGRGMDGALEGRRRSLGILGMRERAASWGGELTIESRPGSGTRVRARLPRARSAES